MTAYGVVPPHTSCRYCGGTGWITCVDYDDTGYEMACPEGCPIPELPPADSQDQQEAPF